MTLANYNVMMDEIVGYVTITKIHRVTVTMGNYGNIINGNYKTISVALM